MVMYYLDGGIASAINPLTPPAHLQSSVEWQQQILKHEALPLNQSFAVASA